jgi:hypothetical protein
LAQEYSDKVNEVILPKTTPGKAHASLKSGKHALLLQIVSDEDYLSEPRGG